MTVTENETIYYAGIGSRETPDNYCKAMFVIAMWFAVMGYKLRSGGASGADSAFEAGVNNMTELHHFKEIYLPWNGFKGTDGNGKEVKKYHNPRDGYYVLNNEDSKAREIAAEFHPTWNLLSSAAQLLMVRNVYQVLGPDLDSSGHSSFVVCWTSDGEASGGTGQAIRIARAYDIPVYNLQNAADFKAIKEIFTTNE